MHRCIVNPKVTVYVTSRNYGRFLTQCLESVFSQTLRAWELIIFDEGSQDDTLRIAKRFESRAPERVRVVAHQEPKGLRECANLTIDASRAEYIIRLDADDYFDENALLVLAAYLDDHPEIGLVYPNWTYISEEGAFLGTESRKKLLQEVHVLDLPPHGACTMIRKRVLKMIGGYDKQFSAQDGHELWMKTIHRFGVANVSTPLFFYRQHDGSMSRNAPGLLEARRQIKRRMTQMRSGPLKPRTVAVVPAKNTYADMHNIVMEPVAGKPLIDHTLDVAVQCGHFHSIIVTTDDPAVLAHCRKRGGVIAFLRDERLSDIRTKLAEVLCDAVRALENDFCVYPDIVAILSVHSPLRRAEHIGEAIDTLFAYDVDQVISTYEDMDLHFRHGMQGMEPLNPGMLNTLRFEREALFVDNGAVHVVWREFLSPDTLHRGRIGHIVMTREESLQIKKRDDLRLIRHQLEGRPVPDAQILSLWGRRHA